MTLVQLGNICENNSLYKKHIVLKIDIIYKMTSTTFKILCIYIYICDLIPYPIPAVGPTCCPDIWSPLLFNRRKSLRRLWQVPQIESWQGFWDPGINWQHIIHVLLCFTYIYIYIYAAVGSKSYNATQNGW